MTRYRWTLRRKLVLGTSVLLAFALLVSGVATIVALRSFVMTRLDGQVLETLDFATGPGRPGAHDGNAAPADGGPSPRVGSLQVTIGSDGTTENAEYVQSDGTGLPLTSAQVRELTAAVPADRTPTTVDLGGTVGTVRAAGAADADGTVVAGNSLGDVTATTTALVLIVGIVGAGVLLAAVLGLSLVVRRSLRPLERVASVAQRVSQRSLAAGDVDIPERVDAADVDPGTEVGLVGSSLNALLGHVESALTARQHSEDRLRRFIADASHELRTPLASIRGYAQLSMGEGAPMTATQLRSLDRIESESERMASLVDDLLLLARLDAGQRLRFADADLTLLVLDAVSDAHAADRERRWNVDVPDEPVVVPGDDDRIRQVLANLLRNARTHTPPGTVVTTSLDTTGDEAVIRVADDGPGIDPAVRDSVFDRFSRGDRSRNRDAGSTGLGLSIVQALVEAHRGSVAVQSEPGRTVFTVRLPLRSGQDPALGPPDVVQLDVPPSGHTPGTGLA